MLQSSPLSSFLTGRNPSPRRTLHGTVIASEPRDGTRGRERLALPSESFRNEVNRAQLLPPASIGTVAGGEISARTAAEFICAERSNRKCAAGAGISSGNNIGGNSGGNGSETLQGPDSSGPGEGHWERKVTSIFREASAAKSTETGQGPPGHKPVLSVPGTRALG